MVPFQPSKYRLLLSALLILSSATALFGAGTIKFSANSVKSSFEKNNEKTTLNGDAKVVTGSLTISADTIEISGSSQRYVSASGRVTVKDQERNIIMQGQNLSYDRTLELVKVQGNAMLEDFGNKVVIRSGLFEYRLKDNLAIMNAGVRLYKEDLEAKAEYATYQRDSSMLELNGLPEVTKGKDTYSAGFIRVNTKTDEIQLLGGVSGTVAPKTSEAP